MDGYPATTFVRLLTSASLAAVLGALLLTTAPAHALPLQACTQAHPCPQKASDEKIAIPAKPKPEFCFNLEMDCSPKPQVKPASDDLGICIPPTHGDNPCDGEVDAEPEEKPEEKPQPEGPSKGDAGDAGEDPGLQPQPQSQADSGQAGSPVASDDSSGASSGRAAAAELVSTVDAFGPGTDGLAGDATSGRAPSRSPLLWAAGAGVAGLVLGLLVRRRRDSEPKA